jgi:hypothetical protein
MTYSVSDLIRDLRSGPYTSIGGYPIFFVDLSNNPLSYKTVRENVLEFARATKTGAFDGISVCAVNWEDPYLYDDRSGERIESAYSERESLEDGLE